MSEMNVEQLIELLKTQDQKAIVEVVKGTRSRLYEGDTYTFTKFNLNEHMEYTDFRGNKFVKKTDLFYGKSFLLLGSAE